jgi:DNA invertase Pin-like site-specific DNA recombinase
VDKDDIPMQKQACHEFAERNGWLIAKEYSEKGISGFKVSAEKRDAIQELKTAAERHEFDVLLVFMFDRLGRIQNETPFIVEWFVAHGIEVWSTQEGQQRFDNEADYLINFMRYWQAGGESRKTSTRVKTRLHQLAESGVYTGGVTPYGYTLLRSGRYNKKNRELMELGINAEEAAVVRLIYNKTVYDGYGSHRMAAMLNGMGKKTHNGSGFQCNTINRILKNRTYCGYLILGNTVSPFIENLQIVDENMFARAQYILAQRSVREDEKKHIAMTTKGSTLLSGNIYCGHCGKKMNATSFIDTYETSDGEEHRTRRQRYICCGKARGRNDCCGQSGYIATKIDTAVTEIVTEYLGRIKQTPKDRAIETRYKKNMTEAKAQQKRLIAEHERFNKQLNDLSNEIAKSIVGDSRFTPEMLANAIENIKKSQHESEEKLVDIKRKIDDQEGAIKNLDVYYSQFRSWADEFAAATLEQRKMIICHLIKAVNVYRGYEIEIEFNMDYQQFLTAFDSAT